MALRSWTSICFFGALLILNVSATLARNLHDVETDPATLDAVDAAKNVVHTEVAKPDADKAEPAKNVDSRAHEGDKMEVKPEGFGRGFPGGGVGGGFEEPLPIEEPIVGDVPVEDLIVGDPGDLPGGEWGEGQWGGGGGGGGGGGAGGGGGGGGGGGAGGGGGGGGGGKKP